MSKKSDKKSQKPSDAQTSKSKTKTLFQQKHEDANPQSLNLFHLERLVRIHAMLGMIAHSHEQRIQYAIDAYNFVLKIFEVSYDHMNQADANREKYASLMDNKNASDQKERYAMPSSFQEWVEFQFPKEYLDKIRTIEHADMISSYVFEKAELTFYYLEQVLDVFENAGLQIYQMPIFSFLR